MEKFKVRDALEGAEMKRDSRCAESISRISVANICFSKASDRPLRDSLNVGTDDWLGTIEGLDNERFTEEEG